MTNKNCPKCGQEFELSDLLRCACGHENSEEIKKSRQGFSVGFVIYTLALITGVGLAIWGLESTIRLYGIEDSANTIDRGGTSLALLILTAVFIVIHIKKGYSYLALPIYCFSYAVLCLTLRMWLRSAAKGFAPSGPDEILGQ